MNVRKGDGTEKAGSPQKDPITVTIELIKQLTVMLGLDQQLNQTAIEFGQGMHSVHVAVNKYVYEGGDKPSFDKAISQGQSCLTKLKDGYNAIKTHHFGGSTDAGLVAGSQAELVALCGKIDSSLDELERALNHLKTARRL
jgi:hypothetical protein